MTEIWLQIGTTTRFGAVPASNATIQPKFVEESLMSIALKSGTRLYSAVCSTELITVTAPAGEVVVTIGGVAVVFSPTERRCDGQPLDGHGGGVAMGNRYVDAGDSMEFLCTKPGDGVPAVDGALMVSKAAKVLPAGD